MKIFKKGIRKIEVVENKMSLLRKLSLSAASCWVILNQMAKQSYKEQVMQLA